ncbi:hypothetical protein ACH0BC_16520, partial [Curtobacterium flaccumfaciens]
TGCSGCTSGSGAPTPGPGGTGTGNQGGDGGPGTGGGVDTAPVAGVEPGGGTGSLAATGADPLPLTLLAVAMLTAGATLTAARPCRRRVDEPGPGR